MRQVDSRTRLEVLDWDACLELLRVEVVGRLAVVDGRRPVIFPVNFVLDGDDIVFRTDQGTKVVGGQRGPVCFEVDQFDRSTRTGWSVVVSGRLEEALPGQRASQRLLDLPVDTWAGDKPRVFRVVADRITGRRVAPPPR